MNVEKSKQVVYKELAEVENDIEVLKENIKKFRHDILEVKTQKDAEEFDNTHDLEDGLVHIRLF